MTEKMWQKKIAVLGGTGFLGSCVAQKLRSHDVEPFVLSRRTGCDILQKDQLKNAFRSLGPEVVINCAALAGGLPNISRIPGKILHDNAMILLQLYEAMRTDAPQAVVVNPISNSLYPDHASVLEESEIENGAMHDSVKCFGASRRLQVALSNCFYEQYGTKSVNWILPNCYGPGDATDPEKVHALNGIVIRMLRAMEEGADNFEIWGSGQPQREWLFVEDAADVLIRSAFRPKDTQISPINIAQNKAYSNLEIAHLIRDIMGYPGRITTNPKIPDGVASKQMGDRAFCRIMPDFEFTPLSDGIAKTIDYYRTQLRNAGS